MVALQFAGNLMVKIQG